jgi:hypothetical protein
VRNSATKPANEPNRSSISLRTTLFQKRANRYVPFLLTYHCKAGFAPIRCSTRQNGSGGSTAKM